MSLNTSKGGMYPSAPSNRKKKIEIFTQNKVMPTQNKVVSLKRQTYQQSNPYALNRNPSTPYINNPDNYSLSNRDRETMTETSSQKSSSGRMVMRANGLRKAQKPYLGGSKVSQDSQNSISHYNNSNRSRPKMNILNSNSQKYLTATPSNRQMMNGRIDNNTNGHHQMDRNNNTLGQNSSHNNNINKLNDYQQLQHTHLKIFKNEHNANMSQNGTQNQEKRQIKILQEEFKEMMGKYYELEKQKNRVEEENNELRNIVSEMENKHKEELDNANKRMQKLYSIVADLEERIRINDRQWNQYLSSNK